jgi:hypothetical protein
MSDFLDNNYIFYTLPLNLEACIAYLKSKVTYDRKGGFRRFTSRPLAVQMVEINEFTIQFEIFLVIGDRKGKARLSGYIQQIDDQTCQISHKMVTQRVGFTPDIIHLLRVFLFIVIPYPIFNVIDERFLPIDEVQWVYLTIGIFILAIILEILVSFRDTLGDIQCLYNALPKEVTSANVKSEVNNYVDKSYEQREVNLSLEECIAYLKSKVTYHSRNPYHPLALKPIGVEISPVSSRLCRFEIFFVEEGHYQRIKSYNRLVGYIEQYDENTSVIYYKLAFKVTGIRDDAFIIRFIFLALLTSPLFLILALLGFSQIIYNITPLLIFFNLIIGLWIKDRQIPRLYDVLPQ